MTVHFVQLAEFSLTFTTREVDQGENKRTHPKFVLFETIEDFHDCY